MNDKSKPFVLEQLEEALEERQTPDRRKDDLGPTDTDDDRRKNDRRTAKAQKAK